MTTVARSRAKPTTADIEAAFATAIAAVELMPPAEIIADGKLHRFASNGKAGDDAGWYILHAGTAETSDGNDSSPSFGMFGCWRADIKQTWCSIELHTLSAGKRRTFERRLREARSRAPRELDTRQAKARKKSNADWARAKPADPAHAYLVKKGVSVHGIGQLDGDLVIPVRDAAGVLHGVQRIDADGNKKFPYGTAKRGHFHLVGEPKGRLLIAEGYATAASIHGATSDAVVVAFDKDNLLPVARALRKKFPAIEIVLAGDNDKDGGGQERAKKAAAAVGGKVVICPDAKDFNDLFAAKGADAVREAFAAAAEPEPEAESIEDAIKRLARLHPVEFDRVAKTEADKLGCNPGTLREQVRKARRGEGGGATNGQGHPIEFAEVELWHEPVDGEVLLAALVSTIREYVIVSAPQVIAIALWAIFTHAFDAFDVAPKLVAKSAQKRSGKSRLAEVLERLVARALYISGITAAALLRIIEMHTPALLLDEMDAMMKKNAEMAEALRGLINSGFNRAGARYIMNVPAADGGYVPGQFSTWAPQFLSGIGDLPDTVRDRSIEIEMKRKLKTEKVKRLRQRDGADLHELQRKTTRWAADNIERLRSVQPNMPPELGDRAADAWEPLLAIADLAGGNWPARARAAALALSGDGVIEDDNFGTMLLGDICEVFTSEGTKQLASTTLTEALVAMTDRPWAEYQVGRAMTGNSLARLLRQYGVRPGTIRLGHGPKDTAKGYRIDQFADAFGRYLPGQSVTPSQPKQTAGDSDFQAVTPDDDVTVSKARKAAESPTCDGVTDETTTKRKVRL